MDNSADAGLYSRYLQRVCRPTQANPKTAKDSARRNLGLVGSHLAFTRPTLADVEQNGGVNHELYSAIPDDVGAEVKGKARGKSRQLSARTVGSHMITHGPLIYVHV
jgi:hypothetical protein